MDLEQIEFVDCFITSLVNLKTKSRKWHELLLFLSIFLDKKLLLFPFTWGQGWIMVSFHKEINRWRFYRSLWSWLLLVGNWRCFPLKVQNFLSNVLIIFYLAPSVLCFLIFLGVATIFFVEPKILLVTGERKWQILNKCCHNI